MQAEKLNRSTLKLLTIITEAVLEKALIQEIENLGAHGFTITDARGKGSRGVRNAAWEVTKNIRLEVVCDKRTAEIIAETLRRRYYDDYAMILFISEVEVLRLEKFTS